MNPLLKNSRRRSGAVGATVLCLAAMLAATGRRAPAAEIFGAAFQPYTGRWTGTPPSASVPAFNSYTQDDVVQMLQLVDTQFGGVATYSAGYAGYYSPTKPWNEVDSNWRVASAAATINQQQQKEALVVSQGIYQQATPGLMQAEINGAFSIASNANGIYPGTVGRLIFTNEYVTDVTTTNQVTQMLMDNKSQAHAMGLQVGVRSNTFGQLTGTDVPLKTAMQSRPWTRG